MSIWNNPKFRSILFQSILIALLVSLFYFLISNTLHNLQIRGINTGFDFLKEKAGFDILMSLVSYSSDSSYGKAFLVGIINTIFVASISILFTTIIGFTVGIARLSSNWIVAKIALIYIELFRNIPLLLQIIFWYGVLTISLPVISDSISIGGGKFFLNNRGLFVPEPITEPGFYLVWVTIFLAIVFSLGLKIWAKKRQDETGIIFPILSVSLATVIILPLVVFLIQGAPLHFEYPIKTRFNFDGGISLIPELTAMVLALSIYTAAFIAEIVRSGIVSVSKSQKEAANSLGIKPPKVLSLVIIPQAMRVIIPQLTSQYLNLTKNSSLATAVGYPDLVAVFAGTALNQTGRAVEIIAVTMTVYLVLSLSISAFMNWYNSRSQLIEK